MVTKCKMQNKQNNEGKRNGQREKENFCIGSGRLLAFVSVKREKNRRLDQRTVLLFIYQMHVHTIQNDCIDHNSVCVCVFVCASIEPREKTDPSQLLPHIWKQFEPFKVGWWLWFAIAVCLLSVQFLFCFSLSLLFVCKISQIFCRRMNRPMHIFCVRRRRRWISLFAVGFR